MNSRPGTLLSLSFFAGAAALLSTAPVMAQKHDTKTVRPSNPDLKTKPAKPGQGEVALKKPFGTVAPSALEVKRALPASDLASAKKMENKTGGFTGKVVKVYAPKGSSLVILNFAENYKAALTAVLRKENFSKFPRMEDLLNKTVLISGKFTLYRGEPQILLTEFSQIKIVK